MRMDEKKFAYMINHWYDMETLELANKLEVTSATLYNWATEFRKMGGDLPRKAAHRESYKKAIIERYIEANPDKVLKRQSPKKK